MGDAVPAKQQVPRLDVAVDQSPLVGVVEPLGNGRRNCDRFGEEGATPGSAAPRSVPSTYLATTKIGCSSVEPTS